MSRRVLLIGGAGFIGHHLALALSARGDEVTVLDGLHVNNTLALWDSRTAPPERAVYRGILEERRQALERAGVRLLVEDARDYPRLTIAFSEVQPQAVILLAAVAHASRANKDPMSTLDHSFRTLENALDNARDRCEHFIFLSSSMVYGNFTTARAAEDHPCEPLGIYGAVKLGGEKLVHAYGNVFNLPYTIVRPSALYGPRCISRRVGQVFIENALQGNDLVIQGDGEDRIDFTAVADLVDGLTRVLDTPAARGEIFNLTYGEARSLNDLAHIVQSQFPGLQLQHIDRPSLLPERGTLDISKARELLGYRPRTPIDTGIPAYTAWYQDFLHRTGLTFPEHRPAQVNE